jgi:hypothetical protein
MKKMTCAKTASALLGPTGAGPAAGLHTLRILALGISTLCMSPAGISAIGIFIAAMPEMAFAQADGEELDMTLGGGGAGWPVAGVPPAGRLAPAEIAAEVRRAGFYPVSRPVRRGRVYVLFAVDQDDMEVKLTVDAESGRVLWVAGAVAHLGGPGYYRSLWHAERPPAPPTDIPGAGAVARKTAPRHAKRFPPLPRTRPQDLGEAQGAEPQASSAVTLVPVAPLE